MEPGVCWCNHHTKLMLTCNINFMNSLLMDWELDCSVTQVSITVLVCVLQ